MSSPRISALILAAGANTRLSGIVAPHFKPLMLVNGRPLIQHALDHARKDWGAEELIIVASPDNVKPLVEVVRHGWGEVDDVDIVIQPVAHNILDAIKRGARMAHHERLLILCADNTFALDGGMICEETKVQNLIAYRDLESDEAAGRFTRINPINPDMTNPKGWSVGREGFSRRVWIGPLLLDRRRVMDVFDMPASIGSIEDFILMCTDMGKTLVPFKMACEDFGVPEMVS